MAKSSAFPDVFWAWFSANEDSMRAGFKELSGLSIKAPPAEMDRAMTRASALLTGLAAALHQFDRRIHPFGGTAADGVIELVFTAEGDRAVFPKVFDLVATAPKVAGWRFVPLKPPQPGGGVQANGVSLDFSETDFLVATEDGMTDVLVVVGHDVDGERELYEFLAHLAVEAQLGEYGHATHVDEVSIANRDELDPDWLDDLQPIAALPDAFPKELPN